MIFWNRVFYIRIELHWNTSFFLSTAFWHIAYWLFLLIYVLIKLSICMRAAAVRFEADSTAVSGCDIVAKDFREEWVAKDGAADKTIRLKCLLLPSGCLSCLPFCSKPSSCLIVRGQSAKGAYKWRCRTFLVMIFRRRPASFGVSFTFWPGAVSPIRWPIQSCLSCGLGF